MDYEKLYKDALERARQFSEHPLQEDSSDIVEYIFPELAESEDERIRKGLIKAVSRIIEGHKLFDTDVTREEALAWLEKQGEKKPTEDAKKLDADNVIWWLKFNVGYRDIYDNHSDHNKIINKFKKDFGL